MDFEFEQIDGFIEEMINDFEANYDIYSGGDPKADKFEYLSSFVLEYCSRLGIKSFTISGGTDFDS